MKNLFAAGLLTITAIIMLTIGIESSFAMGSRPAKFETAKESHAEPMTQPLDALVAEALRNNPEIKFYEAEIETAKGLRKNAGLWKNPEVEGSIGQKRVISSSDEGESSTAKGMASEIVVTQSLEWPGRIHFRKAIANRDIKMAELELAQFRALVTARVKLQAFTLTAAQERAAATSEAADHFRALHKVLLERDQAGLTPVLETRIIEAMALNIQRKASEASLALQAALLDLNQLRGAVPRAAFDLDKLDLKFKTLQKSTDELIGLAQANDYQVRLRILELEREIYGVKLAKNERLPAITAGPVISQERAGEKERIIGAVVSMPFPLWDRNQGNIKVAKAQQTQAEVSLEMARRDAERRIIETTNVYDTKLKEMANWEPDTIQHFKEAAELADRHYRLGAVPISTYVELQSQYLDTIEGLQNTKKEALEAAIQLELLTGIDLSLIDSTPSKTT